MSKFKIGDRVRKIGNSGMVALNGATATVTGNSDEFVYLKWDRNALSGFQMDGGYFESDFELVDPVATQAVPTIGDTVLVEGVITGVTVSPTGTHYNVRLETSVGRPNNNRSLHFAADDVIVVTDAPDEFEADPDNDNPAPGSNDVAVAFDALGDWLRSLAVRRVA